MVASAVSAPLLRRLSSLLYESLLVLGVLGLAFMVPHLMLGIIWNVSVPSYVGWLHVFLVLGGYFMWYWRHGGQTLAMQTWRIRVVDARSGGNVTVSQALLRYAISWPSLLMFGLGLVWALLDRDSQFLHDRIARTRIVLASTPAASAA